MGLERVICIMFVFLLDHQSIRAQDSTAEVKLQTRHTRPDLLNAGFIDVVTNGQVNASARLIRIYVGEPGRFAIPLSIYSGVSSGSLAGTNSLQTDRNNALLLTSFINPSGGLVNVGIDDEIPSRRLDRSLTSLAFIYQLGIRVLTGIQSGLPTDPATGRPVNFFNSYVLGGLYFETGAWEKTDQDNLGLFWMSARYISSRSSSKILSTIVATEAGGFYHGWSFGAGIEINELINLKVIYYQYMRQPEWNRDSGLCLFSFHYVLNK